MGYNWEQGLKGGAGGALGGSAFGPVGTAVGGGIGLLSGFFGGSQGAQQDRLMAEYQRQMGMAPPQAGPAAQSAYSGFRENQSGLVSRLEAMANGQGPSLAKQQFEQATDRNVRSQQAIAASGRGGPLSQLTAANNTAMLGANAAQGSALARTNEQMQAIGQLGGVIAQGRGADEQTNMFNAGETNQTSLANLQARLKAMGMKDEQILGILNQMGGNANQPGMGDQVLAGGAGMFAMGATQNAQNRASNPAKPQGSTMNPFAPPSPKNTINPFNQPYNPYGNPGGGQGGWNG
jgi:hypothetical protein